MASANDYSMTWSDSTLKSNFTLSAGQDDLTTTSLELTGKGLIHWGQPIQENFIKLLENFASNGVAPRAPTVGQFWYNSAYSIPGPGGPAYYNNNKVWQYLAAVDPNTGQLPLSLIPAFAPDGSEIYQGTWNPVTNNPVIVAGTGLKGHFYKVSVNGTRAIDGNSTWYIGDYISFNGATWDSHAGPRALMPKGIIAMWSGAMAAIPSGWQLCNGTNGTPNLLDRFIVSAASDAGLGTGVATGSNYGIGTVGGAQFQTLSTAQMPVHNHVANGSSDAQGSHAHGGGTYAAGSHTHGAVTDAQGYHLHGGSVTTAAGSHNHGSPAGGTDAQGVHAHGVNDPSHVHGWSTGDGGVFVHGSNGVGWYQNTGGNFATMMGASTGISIQNGGNHAHNVYLNVDGNHAHNLSLTYDGLHGHNVTVYAVGDHTHSIATDAQGLHAHNIGVTVANAGGGSAFDNRPPYYALAFIMWLG